MVYTICCATAIISAILRKKDYYEICKLYPSFKDGIEKIAKNKVDYSTIKISRRFVHDDTTDAVLIPQRNSSLHGGFNVSMIMERNLMPDDDSYEALNARHTDKKGYLWVKIQY